MNYSEVMDFVKQKTADSSRPSNYPFRSRYEHTMRVYRWAIRLQAKLGGDLDVIVLAALLHDIGWEQDRPSSEVSAEVAVEYLDSIGVSPELIVKVGEIIMACEELDTDKDLSLECKIVMDSVLLDEVGAVGIMRDCMVTADEEDATYKKAYYRIKEFYRQNKPLIRCCKTEAARTEYSKRMQLIEGYIYQLEKEIF